MRFFSSQGHEFLNWENFCYNQGFTIQKNLHLGKTTRYTVAPPLVVKTIRHYTMHLRIQNEFKLVPII